MRLNSKELWTAESKWYISLMDTEIIPGWDYQGNMKL